MRRAGAGGRSRTVRGVVLMGLAVVAACEGGGIPEHEPARRPSDGLLADARLQTVVERQLHRDGPGLIADLADERADVRARAAFALGSVQAPEALEPLVGALADPEASVRRDAAFALGQLKADAASAVGPLAEAFGREGDTRVRRRILEALGKISVVGASDALVDLDVPDDLEADRTLALAALGGARLVATKAAQDHLLEHLDDLDPRVRQAAAYYLGRLPVSGPWSARVTRVRQALDGYAKDDPAAMYLVQGLGKLKEPFDRERLREWATTAEDWRTRANAMTALAEPRLDRDTREVLFAGLNDSSAHVAVSAANALAQGVPVLADMQRMEAWIEGHPDRWQVVQPLLVLLARMDEQEFVFAWIDALPEDDANRWGVGLQALAALPGEAARDRLARASESTSTRLAGDAVAALARRWTEERIYPEARPFYFERFSDAVRSGNVRAAFTAAPVLADSALVPFGSADTLVAAWSTMMAPRDIEAMTAVLGALGTVGGPEAEEVLRQALRHPHPALRAAAAQALTTATGDTVAVPPAGVDSAEVAGDPMAIDWSYLAELGPTPRLVLETDRGRVVLRLETEEAPQTVQTIARLAEQGRYDGVPFHRVVPNFVVQGGDFASGDGFGGPGFTITSEFTEMPFVRGVIGMASAGKDTEGSQFFITHSMQPHLDGSYTTFGYVVEGMDVVDRLLIGDRIVRATIERGR